MGLFPLPAAGKQGSFYSAKMEKIVVVDCRDHMLGRLASVIAKQLLNGQHVVAVRTEAITISGGLVRQKMKFSRFLRLRINTNPKKGPIHYRSPARILWRTVRGMIPHKTKRGACALECFKAFEGVPPPYDKVKRAVVPDALKVLRLQTSHKFCTLGKLAAEVGWKHGPTVATLEEKGVQVALKAKAAAAKDLKALEATLAPVGMA